MTKVVSVKVKYIRPKYNDLREWRREKNNVYIGRAGVVFIDRVRYPKVGSLWANPFKVGKDGSREEVLDLYEEYVRGNELMMRLLPDLKGKTLGCWCKPEGCHGDVLVKLLNEI